LEKLASTGGCEETGRGNCKATSIIYSEPNKKNQKSAKCGPFQVAG
jgi:hypothetical protein